MQKLIIMKKVIISLSVAGFISLGFTVVVNSSSSKEAQVKTKQNSNLEKYEEISENNDKRLANWDWFNSINFNLDKNLPGVLMIYCLEFVSSDFFEQWFMTEHRFISLQKNQLNAYLAKVSLVHHRPLMFTMAFKWIHVNVQIIIALEACKLKLN